MHRLGLVGLGSGNPLIRRSVGYRNLVGSTVGTALRQLGRVKRADDFRLVLIARFVDLGRTPWKKKNCTSRCYTESCIFMMCARTSQPSSSCYRTSSITVR